ncbi:MAG: glutathione S-transferase family protein [Proteobacteria bacterium]|nr:glutathione S-transferase family protein [Pseudomonadota bacterium]
MIDVYWSANSPFCWRVLLTLELKGLAWRSFPMQTDLQAHKAPQMLAMNPRGRLPVVKDGDYVVFESLAVLYYLDRKYPTPPIFGQSAEEGGVIMRVINEFQAYTEEGLMRIVRELQTRDATAGRGAHPRHVHRGQRGAHRRGPARQG